MLKQREEGKRGPHRGQRKRRRRGVKSKLLLDRRIVQTWPPQLPLVQVPCQQSAMAPL